MKIFLTALKTSLPAVFCYFPLGIVYGVLCLQQGYTWFEALLFSTIILAGAMQFLALILIPAGASLLTLSFSLIPLGARNIFYGITMNERYRSFNPFLKIYLAHGLVDATYSLLLAGPRFEGKEDQRYVTWLTILVHLSWVLGTLMGTIVDHFVELPKGLEFSLTAFFAAAAIEQLLKKRDYVPMVIALTSILVAAFVMPQQFFLGGVVTAVLMCLILPSRKSETA